ncbi:MAG: glycerol-3-phosphate 1-O-acyltransferase PlsY [Zetaproteobacteria bacterium]|nr:glycerol-3-phosphate 1-O-acyltransferase PlsY [Zetaproteobacteria bacterium]
MEELDFITVLPWFIMAYLLGAIPFGLLFSRWLSGVDPREHGSGNIGATNAMRAGGKRVGALTLIADITKGAIPVGLSVLLHASDLLILLLALSAFLGHIFPVYLNFKGGKGVATMYGVLLPWLPWVAVGSFVIWFVVYKVSRYVSLASIIAGLVLLPFAYLVGASEVTMVGVTLLGLIMVGRHWENIKRLLAGEEPKTA